MSADTSKRSSLPILLMIGFLVLGLIMYMAILGWRGVQLIAAGTPTGIGVGLGVLILPVLGAWMIYSTLSAGLWHQRLAAAAGEQGRDLDVSGLPRRPSGRLERDAADALFDQVRAEWEADPDDWCNTYRIARAYDYAGDRTRARQMMKTAVAQYRSSDPERR
ncbi:hypothetical protein GOARA_036_00270 [Gordonia araii NBRC 100433]|uniref:Tetratricopeptide repeat protein n=1 Tax=Gordonia araii NBRC 100433 TaxID=1073574 RepID=G7H0C0_9ACTN|nr:hypothetical protein [Gordonia araii]NNG96940.1 hypothetical protein [Gordonia araii NBRC 100433]GAB09295.1 hypothetical protein GOARA_036_00270 [Gordonia araii NBRC 100433]